MAHLEPEWWSRWQAAHAARHRPGTNPFGIPLHDGTLSGFVVPAADWHPAQHMAKAKVFVETLATIEIAKRASVAYGWHANFTDLDTRSMVLDATIIQTCPFRPAATLTQRLDILGGLCLHEALHLRYSSARLCRQAQQRGALFAHLHNILEDEYIEGQLPRTSPGYVGYLQAARTYMFEDAHTARVVEDVSLLNTFLLFVRHPQRLTWQATAQYGHELQQMQRILTPFPASGHDVYRAAEQIHDLFQQGQHGGPEPTHRLTQFLDEISEHQLGSESVLNRVVEALINMRDRKGRLRSAPPRNLESDLARHGEVTWDAPTGNQSQYERDRQAVRPYIQRLRRWIEAWERPAMTLIQSASRGRLDRRALHTIPQGNARLFRRPAASRARPLTMVLLIDESGSMEGEKIAAARQVAVLFKEALASVNTIELFIFGHSADGVPLTTNIFRYWAPGWKHPYSLGSISARNNNRDGVAIQAVAQAVKRLATHQEMILVVISDGAPHAQQYQNEAAIAHTRAVVKHVQRDMAIMQVAIEPALDSARMFDHAVHFTDLDALPSDMMRLFRRLIS